MHQLWHNLTHPWPVAVLSAGTFILVLLWAWALVSLTREDRRLARCEEARRLANEAYDREPRPAYVPPSPEEQAARDAEMIAAGYTRDTLCPIAWTKPVPRPPPPPLPTTQPFR